MMTNQEIFDKSVSHLLKQGAKSKSGIMCKYRASDGRMCAVGVLIKDEFYDPQIESETVRNELVRNAFKLSGVSVRGMASTLLGDLQELHDETEVEDWPNESLRLAKSYGLNPRVVKEHLAANQ